MQRHRETLTAFAAAAVLILMPTGPVAADTPPADVVSAVDFEDGTTGTWTQSGAPTLEVVADPLGGDGQVLSVSDRSEDWDTLQSPSGLFEEGATYSVSARVLIPDAAADARFIVKDGFHWVGNTAVPAGEWTTISGQFTADADDTQIYVEVSPTLDFYVDDILVTTPGAEVCEPSETTVLAADFADGALPTGLRQSGGSDGTLTVADGVLAVNDRAQDFVGIETVPGLLDAGVEYAVSADVRLGDGTPATQARWVAVPGYTWIGNAGISTDEWTTLTGTWTVPADDDGTARLYIGTGDIAGLDSYTYYVDNVTMTATIDDCEDDGGGPIHEPGTVLIDEDFEGGDLGGWFARDGSGDSSPTVAVVPGGAAGTGFAAEISDRGHEGDGLQFDVTELLLPGQSYELEAYVRFAPGEEIGRGLTVSMRTVTGTSTAYGNLIQIEEATASGWVKVSGRFTVPNYDTAAELYFEARYNSGNASTFLVDEIVVRVPEPDLVDTSLVPIRDTVDFPVGVAIDSRETTGAAAQLLLHHFDQITPENHMKVENWYDADRNFQRHSEATALLDFARDSNLRLYGHVLLWHSQSPAWFFQAEDGRDLTSSEADRQFLRDRLEEHIDNVARSIYEDYGPYGSPTNPMVGWDVVNEVVSDQQTADGLRPSRWYEILGEEYIHLAFELAEEAFNVTYAADGADRPVKLFINDYNTEQDRKGAQYEALVRRMLDVGTPLDGVGHQFHVSVNSTISSLEAALDRFAGMGLLQTVTELDVTINPATEANLVRQGHFYRDAFELFRSYHAAAPESEKLFATTVWGLTDTRSWRSEQLPLLFTGGLQAKHAYFGVVGDPSLAPLVTTASVFGGSVPLEEGFTSVDEWLNLPENPLTANAGGFQLRWDDDHLTVLVRTTADADRVEFTYGDLEFFYEEGAAGSVAGVRAEVDGVHYIAVHLPHEGVAVGSARTFDVRVYVGEALAGAWNSPGATGQLTFLEPLSYLKIPELPAPTVDSSVDDVWSDAAVVSTARTVEGNAQGARAEVRTLWQGNRLYVLYEVTDPAIDSSNSDPWNRDSIELFLDLGNTKSGPYGPNDTQIRVTLEGEVSFGTGSAALQQSRVADFATAQTDTGYVIELAVDLIGQSGGQSDVPLGGLGTFHGIDFQVNDGRNGSRYAVHTWAEPTGTGYQNTARWGVAQLVSALDEEPVESQPVDKAALAGAIAAAGSLDPEHYTADSWAAFVAALTDAQGVLADGDATQAEVDAALAALTSARAALVAVEPGGPGGPTDPGTDLGTTPGTDPDTDPGTDPGDGSGGLPPTGVGLSLWLAALGFIAMGGLLVHRRQQLLKG